MTCPNPPDAHERVNPRPGHTVSRGRTAEGQVSVSIPGDDVRFLDDYATQHGVSGRSAVVQRALALLRAAELVVVPVTTSTGTVYPLQVLLPADSCGLS
jgi:hypothetical protein